MKKSVPALIFLFFFGVSNILAQEKEKASPFRMPDHVYVQSSFSWEHYASSLSDFMRLSPYLNAANDLSDYADFSLRGLSSSLMLKGGYELKKKNGSRGRLHPELRLGLGFRQAVLLREQLYLNEQYRVDTLVSLSNGEKLLIDSFVNKVYHLFYVSRGVQFSGEILFRSNPEALISVFAGAGFGAAFQFANKTLVRLNENGRVGGGMEAGDVIFHRYVYYRKTLSVSPSRSSLSVTLYLPLGMQLRVGRKTEYRGAAYIYFEALPLWSYARIPELNRNLNGFSLGHSLGLRVSLP